MVRVQIMICLHNKIPLSFHPLSAMRILKFISFLFGISLALLGYVVHSSNNWILISDCGMFFLS